MNKLNMRLWLWEFYALGYDALSISLPHKFIRERVMQVIKAHKKGTYFDLGCGTGTMLLTLSKDDKESKMIGVDASYTMVSISRIKQILWQRGNVSVLWKSADDLASLNNNSVDIVYSINTLFTLPNPTMIMNKIVNMLKGDGVIVIALPTENFSSTGMVREHIKLLKKLSFAKRFLNIMASILLIPLWTIVLISNLLISLMEKSGTYTIYNKSKALALIHNSGLKLINYEEILSRQMMVVTAEKI